jgi:hypothetical protein
MELSFISGTFSTDGGGKARERDARLVSEKTIGKEWRYNIGKWNVPSLWAAS